MKILNEFPNQQYITKILFVIIIIYNNNNNFVNKFSTYNIASIVNIDIS